MNDQVPDGLSRSPDYLPDVWYLMAGRISPEMCCQSLPPADQLFRAALREVSHQNGDLDYAVSCLREIVTYAPPDWMVFGQAGQLLNILEWRRRYHKPWFTVAEKGRRIKPGKCAPYIARAIALMQIGSDKEVLDLTSRILDIGNSESADRQAAHLIRAAVLICSGEIDDGEDELRQITGDMS
ncbi:MAG TPA: hypothetical protein VN372_15570 [Methanospirillum sp.]|nr:hypothetical protein [Methanospirillum sp.]